MEGAPNDGTSADPAMTPIERQMQVIATSIQDLARETSRQNQELWQAIRKGPPTPHDNNQPPPRGGNRSNDQEADSHQVTRRRGGEVERTPPRSRHRAESAGSSAPPSQHKTAKTTRSSKQPERPDRSSKQPEREDRRGNSSRQPDHPDRSTRDPDDKTAHLEKELREMRKQMGDMKNSLRAKAARNLDNLVHRADSPFIPSIADFPLPSRFKVPLLENFDGTKDPFDYLEAFKTVMQLQAVPEEVMCRAFPLGLRGSARVWFNKLESESIGSFVQLSRAFIDHFIGSQRRGRPPTHLLSVKQMEGESLRTFVHRFNEEAMKIDRPKEDVTVTAFMAGLRKGDFLYELCKDPPETMSELMYEATKHMNAEDALEAMEDPPPKRRKEAEDRKPEPAKQKVPKFTETPERKRTTAPPVKFSSFTPLNTPIDKLLMQIQDDPSLRWPGKIRSDPNSRPKNLYCRFHRDHGHLTEECVALKEQIDNTHPTGQTAEEKSEPSLEDQHQEEPQGRAYARKAYARQVQVNIMVVQRPPKNIRLDDQIISFSEEDARGTHQPHDDALVITINIAGFTTRRVMVDNGSSADILYLPAYQQMRLDKDKLRPMDAPLVGFTGDKICPVGIVTLPITVGTHPKTVSKTVDFLRPRREVRGDQVAARECYLASLGSGGQNQTMTIEEQKILVKPSGELDTIELEDGRPERTTKIGAELPPKIKESLVQFLKDNKDVFAWSHEDMPGINPSIISHKLNVDPSLRPIKQKRRVFAPEAEQCHHGRGGQTPGSKLHQGSILPRLAANFIREVFYPDWLANVVMVKKSYNQIGMDEGDQEKTSFITSRGLFCYKVMPFGLKNAGATYQRLMNRMFKKMNRMFHDTRLAGRNVEITFRRMSTTCWKISWLYGFAERHRSKPRQDQSNLRNAEPPKNTKESTKTDGKKDSRTESVHVSIHRQLKKYLTEPPLLSPSKQGEELYLYLAVSPTAVSSALIREEEARRQLPVYYTSRALRGAEERYPPMEKLAFALVTAARKLRPYFQAHTIVLLTNHPLRKAMNKPDAAGRLYPVKVTSSNKQYDCSTQPPTTKLNMKLFCWGSQTAKILGATELDVHSDSQLVVGQVNGDYEPKEGRMQQYLHWSDINNLQGSVVYHENQIRGRPTGHESASSSTVDVENQDRPTIKPTGNRLAKSASSSTPIDKTRLKSNNQAYKRLRWNPIHTETPIISYLQRGALRYHNTNRRRSQTIKGARALQRKIVRAGYYWPSMKADAYQFVQRCDKCQRFANHLHSPPAVLVPMTAPWPFAQWGLDIMGPLPIGRRQLKFLVKFLRSIAISPMICRFGIPRVLVSDNGKQFDNPRFRQFSQELGIHNHYSSPGHPQANGQVEVTNRSLLKLIKTRLEGAKGLWPEELPSILWAYRTTVRIPTGETPFRMTFGSEAVVPVEIGLTTFRTSAYDEQENEEQLRLNLDLIDEVRETAETRMKRYQEKMARHYNSRVKPRYQLSVGGTDTTTHESRPRQLSATVTSSYGRLR
uniref:Integrase catalytic domain-containing protein n=1 Tax=Fagus sylvatica TaxID=28930 RepID=A0A2N9HF13_FAGSY